MLWNCDPNATVFQSYDWVATWLEIYQRYVDEIFLVVCYCGDKLVALAPFYIRKQKWLFLEQKQLMFCGTGEPEPVEVVAEYMDVLAVPALRERCIALVGRAIADRRDIGAVILSDLIATNVQSLLACLEETFVVSGRSAVGFNYSIAVTDSEIPQTFTSSQRRTARTKRKRLARLPGFKLVFADDAETTERLFAALVELHNMRWQGKGAPGVFAERLFCEFHRKIIATIGRQQGVLLFGLEVSGKLMAVQYCLISNETCHYYQSGFDDAFQPNVSPGFLCHAIAHEQCERLGIKTYDLMTARADGYKARLAVKQHVLAAFEGFRSRAERAKHTLVSALGAHVPPLIVQDT